MDKDLIHRSKRQRSLSSSSSSSASSSHSNNSNQPSLPTKYHRSSLPTTSTTYTCTLPPTCNTLTTPTTFDSQQDLERHQECFHKFICHAVIRDRAAESQSVGKGKGKEVAVDDIGMPAGFVGRSGGKIWKECGKVFPEERLFELHQIETHDPLWREKQARGDKIFQCFLPNDQCSKTFFTPAKRRRHLIDKHKYPQQFFFGITNHGLNLLAATDGMGVSLIRPRKDPPTPIHPLPTSKSTDLIAPKEGYKHLNGGDSNPTRNDDMDHVPPIGEVVPPRLHEDARKEGESGVMTNQGMINIEEGFEVVGGTDVDMDALITSTAGIKGLGSSLGFLPRGLRKKGQGMKVD